MVHAACVVAPQKATVLGDPKLTKRCVLRVFSAVLDSGHSLAVSWQFYLILVAVKRRVRCISAHWCRPGCLSRGARRSAALRLWPAQIIADMWPIGRLVAMGGGFLLGLWVADWFWELVVTGSLAADHQELAVFGGEKRRSELPVSCWDRAGFYLTLSPSISASYEISLWETVFCPWSPEGLSANSAVCWSGLNQLLN